LVVSSRRQKKNKEKSNTDCSCSDYSYEDEEISNFIRKLKKGTKKYKGMIPFKSYNCHKIGHFENKFHNVKSDSDEEEDPKKENKYQKGNKKRDKKKVFNKNIYQENIVIHMMKMMKVIVTHKEYSLWLR
jgi:hypothetical protein